MTVGSRKKRHLKEKMGISNERFLAPEKRFQTI
jgi:hypothetical protein